MNWLRMNGLGRIVALFLVISVVGCAKSKTGTVNGRVTFNGKPAPVGSIVFNPEVSGPPSTGQIGPDGSYTLQTPHAGKSVVVGNHLVMINSREGQHRYVPAKYDNIVTSGLNAEVKEGPNTINFDLVDEQPKN